MVFGTYKKLNCFLSISEIPLFDENFQVIRSIDKKDTERRVQRED